MKNKISNCTGKMESSPSYSKAPDNISGETPTGESIFTLTTGKDFVDSCNQRATPTKTLELSFAEYLHSLKNEYNDAESLISNISSYYSMRKDYEFMSNSNYDLIEQSNNGEKDHHRQAIQATSKRICNPKHRKARYNLRRLAI